MHKIYQYIRNRIVRRWRMFWLRRSGPRNLGRVAAWFASRHTAPYHQRSYLANLLPQGFVAASARLSHPDLRLGNHVYVGDRVFVSCTNIGGTVELQDRVHLYGDSFIETGMGGRILIEEATHIQPGCHLHAYLSEIRIGRQVEIAPGCGFYNYNHGTAPGRLIMDQPLHSSGGISVGDGAWIGYGVSVLQGVTIGEGAVIAAGAVVTHNVPANAIAAGVPARIVGYRSATKENASRDTVPSPPNYLRASSHHGNHRQGIPSAKHTPTGY